MDLLDRGEKSLAAEEPKGYSEAKKGLERFNIDAVDVSLTAVPEVPENMDALVFAGPKAEYLPYEVNALKSYLDRGGRIFLMIDPPRHEAPPLSGQPGPPRRPGASNRVFASSWSTRTCPRFRPAARVA